jgi:dihydroceramide fatty acyl 2-hydroxylase
VIRFRSFWIFPIAAIALLLVTHRRAANVSTGQLFWLCLAGLAIWTFLEYILHRFFLHGLHLGSGSHMLHHEAPRDPDKILVQPFSGLIVSAAVFGFLALVTGNLFRAAGIMTGIWAGFLYYESVHYRIHVSLKSSALLQRQRRAHFHHHFRNPDQCFGVTTPVWDYLSGTRRRMPKS